MAEVESHRDGAEGLVKLFRAGDERALRLIFDRFGPAVFHLAMHGPASVADAEDVTRSTFVAAWQARERFNPARGSLLAWLLGIARRKLSARGPEPSPERVIDQLVLADELARLPGEQRRVLELAFYDDLTHGQIAAVTELPPDTVKNHLGHGMTRLQRRWEVDGVASPLEDCDTCGSEIAELGPVAGIGRETQDVRDLPAPPEHVWHMINADVGTAETPRRHELHRRRRPTWRATALIAAAAALIAVLTTVSLVRGAPVAAAACTAAPVRLSPSPGAPTAGTGTACLVSRNGERALRVSVSGLPAPAGGFYEVRLVDPSSRRTAPIGALATATTEDFPLPSTVDISRYRVVEVAAEPADGDAAHADRSLLRGAL